MKLRLDEPIIVLTCARSGSTLLRLILDSHPDLACPPETGVVNMCTSMGLLSMLLEGPSPAGSPNLSDLATAAIRSWVTTNFGAYLMREGKARWCEKSLGAAESASRFLTIFPKARFICVYRHCLDVIDSVLEACPFGLRGYGLDPFSAAHPGNSIAAIADYWVSHIRAISDFEQAHPDVCLRLRYEDLVTDPAGQAGRIFAFLGEQTAPGLTDTFLANRSANPFGPSDHKVWSTSSINTDSIGRGTRLPIEIIPTPVIAMANGLLERLSYEPLGGSPGRLRPTAASPAAHRAAPWNGADDAGAGEIRSSRWTISWPCWPTGCPVGC